MEMANETLTMFASTEAELLADKTLFVNNLGWLLAQTRNGVAACKLIDNDTVKIIFSHGERLVNIACDSYAAIARDVLKNI